MLSAQRVIELLRLEPLPIEGGYFRRTYLADEQVDAAALPARYAKAKPLANAIYYLVTARDFSALHRLKSDELYHFYLGAVVELLLLYPDGSARVIELGTDLEAGQHVQFLVPRDVWQGSRVKPGGEFALMGTTLAPAWDADDFELGDRDALIAQYPGQAEWIRALTRERD